MSKLKALHQKDKRAIFTYPNSDFKVEIRFLQPSEVDRINQECQVMKYNKNLKGEFLELDNDKFVSELAKYCVVGWTGLTFAVASDLLPLDESAIEDMSEEIEYCEEDAVEIIRESATLSEWVLKRARDLKTFRRLADTEGN